MKKKVLDGKVWLRSVLNKSYRKSRVRKSGSPNFVKHGLHDTSNLLLCGDIESNPGPKPEASNGNNKEKDFDSRKIMDTLARMEAKYDAGIAKIEKKCEEGVAELKEIQGTILNRLTNIENEMGIIKNELEKTREDISETRGKVSEVENRVFENFCRIHDAEFLIDRQEQYSRKNSIRIRNVREERGEQIEELTIKTLKDELDLVIDPTEIDIVHRVGRYNEGKHRAILVKFMSHKSKEKVMQLKKNAPNVKIHEDLAPGIKKIYDHLSFGRRSFNIESIWTIDGRIKYRLNNNPRAFEIRSYADYDKVINVSSDQ